MVEKKTTKPRKKSAALNAQEQAFVQVFSAIADRAAIASRLGKSYAGDRDLYEALGYKTLPTYTDFVGRYKRQDVARAVINAPVNACWRVPPRITESEEKETAFEKKWNDIVKKRQVYRQFSRVDKLAGIGNYAVLLLGFNDNKTLADPVENASELLYLQPYGQSNASISTYENDSGEARFGLPKMYSLTMKQGTKTSSVRVHHSRIVHIAEDLLEDNVEGLPKLEVVLNRLEDLERVVGGSAEMFWRGAFPGLGFKKDPDATFDPQTKAELTEQIESYMHGLKRYLRLENVSIESIAQQVSDPSKHADVILTLISAATRIPKRILLGSERGELASSMDEKNWLQIVDDRRTNHCEPSILRPVLDQLIDVKILPTPVDGYSVEWSDLMAPSDKEVAEVGAVRAKAIKDYLSSPGADIFVPPEAFLRKVLGFTQDEIDEINKILEGIDESDSDIVPDDESDDAEVME